MLAVIFDESAFWRDESSANPDVEVYRAVLPSLIRTGGTLVSISTPYRKFGLLYQRHRNFFGKDDAEVLVVAGDSRSFNPTLSEKAIVQAMADDPQAGASEWYGEFRADIGAFLADADIDACVDANRPAELPRRDGVRYSAFADPSGGRHDSFTVCIAHKEGERVVVDVVRGREPPFDTQAVTREYAQLLGDYHLNRVTGDSYSAEWVVSAFAREGITYQRSAMAKAQLYIEGLPHFTRRTVALPEHPKLLRELRLLERRPHVGGRDTIDHGRISGDDHANCVFGVLRETARPQIIYSTRTLCDSAGSARNGKLPPSMGFNTITGKWEEVPPKEEPRRTRINVVRIKEADAPAVRDYLNPLRTR
jgi:hypothetical protein